MQFGVSIVKSDSENVPLTEKASKLNDELSSSSYSPHTDIDEALAFLWLASKQGSEVAQSILLEQFLYRSEKFF